MTDRTSPETETVPEDESYERGFRAGYEVAASEMDKLRRDKKMVEAQATAYAHELAHDIAAKSRLAPTPDHVSWSDEDYQRARDCMLEILRGNGWSVSGRHGETTQFDNAFQHAVGILSLTASPNSSTDREIEHCQDCGQELPIRYPCYEQGCAIKCRF